MADLKQSVLLFPKPIEQLFEATRIRLNDTASARKDAIKATCFSSDAYFHADRLQQQKETIKKWLSYLPSSFEDGVQRTGNSLCAAFKDRDGHIWTGEETVVEKLFLLGQGIGLVRCMLPRECWPDGIPILCIMQEPIPSERRELIAEIAAKHRNEAVRNRAKLGMSA